MLAPESVITGDWPLDRKSGALRASLPEWSLYIRVAISALGDGSGLAVADKATVIMRFRHALCIAI
jgi:hypothetical protein